MILAPEDFSMADCDGVIFESSNVGKVSAFDKINAVVNFTILGDNYPKKVLLLMGYHQNLQTQLVMSVKVDIIKFYP